MTNRLHCPQIGAVISRIDTLLHATPPHPHPHPPLPSTLGTPPYNRPPPHPSWIPQPCHLTIACQKRTPPPFLAEPPPPTHLPRQYPPYPKQKISDCATLLSHHQNCLAARLRRQQFTSPKQKISDCATLVSHHQQKPSRTPAATTQMESRNVFNTLQKPQERRDPLPRQRPRPARRLLYRPRPRRQGLGVALTRRQGLVSRRPRRQTHTRPPVATPSINCPPASTRSSRASSNPPPSPPFPAPQKCSSNSTASPTRRWT